MQAILWHTVLHVQNLGGLEHQQVCSRQMFKSVMSSRLCKTTTSLQAWLANRAANATNLKQSHLKQQLLLAGGASQEDP